jgi:hypothetical protein
MPVLFDLGDIVSLIESNGVYQGVITKMVFIPADETGEEFQWIHLNNAQFSSQYASYRWKKIGTSVENLPTVKKPYKCKI